MGRDNATQAELNAVRDELLGEVQMLRALHDSLQADVAQTMHNLAVLNSELFLLRDHQHEPPVISGAIRIADGLAPGKLMIARVTGHVRPLVTLAQSPGIGHEVFMLPSNEVRCILMVDPDGAKWTEVTYAGTTSFDPGYMFHLAMQKV